ncbi:unnamed protein product [Paramecium primaurelia]|uniref:Uncharacterized protein n=1 Tax=Paramecium primaurelia TaxID=5886 RepID=A0A8S1P918_PARPR|nr:unnamed protein product [Paramecium primaurelia]
MYNTEDCSQPKFEDLKNLKCANPEHQNPIQLIILDQNLKQNQRLLCQSCIKDFESNQKTIGFERAISLTYENYQKKKELRDIVLNENIKLLEELKSNFLSIKTFVNQIIEEMMQSTQFWMKDLNQIKQQQYQFYDEIDQLINQNQNIEIDQIVQETKTLNNKWISKLKEKIEWFSKFQSYSDCVNKLKNLSEGKVENSQLKNDLGLKCQQQQQTLQSDCKRGNNLNQIGNLKEEKTNNQPQQQGKKNSLKNNQSIHYPQQPQYVPAYIPKKQVCQQSKYQYPGQLKYNNCNMNNKPSYNRREQQYLPKQCIPPSRQYQFDQDRLKQD